MASAAKWASVTRFPATDSLIKSFFKDLEIYQISNDFKDKEKIQKKLRSVYSLIDKGTKKNVFHKNTAARKKARVSAYLKEMYSSWNKT